MYDIVGRSQQRSPLWNVAIFSSSLIINFEWTNIVNKKEFLFGFHEVRVLRKVQWPLHHYYFVVSCRAIIMHPHRIYFSSLSSSQVTKFQLRINLFAHNERATSADRPLTLASSLHVNAIDRTYHQPAKQQNFRLLFHAWKSFSSSRCVKWFRNLFKLSILSPPCFIFWRLCGERKQIGWRDITRFVSFFDFYCPQWPNLPARIRLRQTFACHFMWIIIRQNWRGDEATAIDSSSRKGCAWQAKS